MQRICFWLFSLLLFPDANVLARGADPFDRIVTPYLEEHCIECHSGPKPKSALDLESAAPASLLQDSELWLDLVARIESGDMPPAKRPRPPEGDTRQVVTTLSQLLAELRQESSAARLSADAVRL